jgi:hypothetical protein
MRVIAAAVGAALLAGGCGSSATSGAVARAASDTTKAPGYRLAGLVTIASPAAGTITEALTGTFDRADQLGSIRTVAMVAGRSLQIRERVSHLTVYMDAGALPGGVALTGGRPWIEIDMSRAIGAIGVSALPTATDPTQFVDYLRAVSSATSSAGVQIIRGVPAQHYHATVDLDRYPNLVSPAQHAAVGRSVKTLESALGSHTLPLDVWVDIHGLVRRLSLAFDECVSHAHFRFGMTIDLYDYGPQAPPRIPRPSRVYDVTPVITSALRHVKLGCG